VLLAIGLRGNPRWLGVPGEELEHVYHRLYSPRHYEGEEILVVGGGNSAVEAALALAEQNRVTISYRGAEFSRLFKDNRRKLEAAAAAGAVRLKLESRVRRFEADAVEFESGERIACRRAFVLIGAEAPAAFLRSLGVRLENDWTGNPFTALLGVIGAFLGLWMVGANSGAAGAIVAAASFGALCRAAWKGNRFALLGASFVICYSIYGVKGGDNAEYWPYRGWGHKALSFFNRPWSFWYTVLYTAAMTVFGARAMKRWGFDRKDRFQIWRYVSLIGFQWIFFFLIPEFLFKWAVEYQWVGAKLAADPNFAGNAWRSYGLIYAWPLFFYTFFGAPHQVWLVWGALLSFVFIPLLALFHGKRYCSWICGCGGLAETLGDRWRHLAPKGRESVRWEFMNTVMLWFAAAVTVLMLAKDTIALFRAPAEFGLAWYHVLADVWLVGIIPVALYPLFGGKIWCRYWCPLAKMMQVFSAVFTRFRVSRFAIHANDKCIACGECSRNCQVGIDVMDFAMKQNELNNFNTSCIGCGICITVCPMNVLSFTRAQSGESGLVQIQPAA
jgi:polyferredoxin